MTVRNINESDVCEVEGCDVKSRCLVYSRHLSKVIICCNTHTNEVSDETFPEYIDTCDNCKCRLPIN